MRKLAKIFYYIIFLLDKFLFKIIKRNLIRNLLDILTFNSYKNLYISNHKLKFFIPSSLTEWRVDTFYHKEPETLEWINNFINKKDTIFWDIGANRGLYSIYNAIKNNNVSTIAFEPSTSNLRVLTRNISINNLQNNINVFPLPLTNKQNIFQNMNEGSFIEGGALNTFGEKFDFEGKNFEPEMRYNIFGTTINYLILNDILDVPDYIKIDVDGIEHIILEGGNKVLSNNKIKSISIEVNENFLEQYQKVMSLMNEFGFKILHKKNNEKNFAQELKFKNTYNYVFIRCD